MSKFVTLHIGFGMNGAKRFNGREFRTAFTWETGALEEHINTFKRQCAEQLIKELQNAHPVEGGRPLKLGDETLAVVEADIEVGYAILGLTIEDNELPKPPASPSPYEQALTDTQAMMAQIAALQERHADKSCEERDRIEIAIAALDRALANLAHGTAGER